MAFRWHPVAALRRSIETIQMLDEACGRIDRAELANVQT
jgi:hypothetical protein